MGPYPLSYGNHRSFDPGTSNKNGKIFETITKFPVPPFENQMPAKEVIFAGERQLPGRWWVPLEPEKRGKNVLIILVIKWTWDVPARSLTASLPLKKAGWLEDDPVSYWVQLFRGETGKLREGNWLIVNTKVNTQTWTGDHFHQSNVHPEPQANRTKSRPHL